MISWAYVQNKRASVLVALSIVLFVTFLWYHLHFASNHDSSPLPSLASNNGKGVELDDKTVLAIPSDYSYVAPESEYCTTRFTPRFLELLRDRPTQYCSSSSTSHLTCFHVFTNRNGQPDSLCVGQKAVVDTQAGIFALDCQLRTIDDAERKSGAVPFNQLHSYWYETGPRYILDRFINLEASNEAHQAVSPEGSPNDTYVLLVKREGEGNPWHCLMELFSMSMTFDVLRMAKDPTRQGRAYFTPADRANTQVVILDSRSDGPYIDLWGLFSDKPVLRLKDYIASAENQGRVDNLIFPLPGGANPQWQNDWNVYDCSTAPLLQTFVRRVLRFYGLPEVPPDSSAKTLTVTFIDRDHRRLLNQDKMLQMVRDKFPEVTVQVVDFSALSFVEQLRAVGKTDVLVGVHGAGLTHGMFMRGNTAMVEILPPELNHKGFRNMASMLGRGYFSAHGSRGMGRRDTGPEDPVMKDGMAERRDSTETEGAAEIYFPAIFGREWHDEDVILEETRFLELMSLAIKSLYNKGMRNIDAN